MEFEWDERKRRASLERHDLDFIRARSVFERPHYTYPSPREEERWVTLGAAVGRVVAVMWTSRGNVVRVISMRRARREEERQYRHLHE